MSSITNNVQIFNTNCYKKGLEKTIWTTPVIFRKISINLGHDCAHLYVIQILNLRQGYTESSKPTDYKTIQ